MNKTLKWILGAVAVLLIMVVIAGIGYLVFSWWGGMHWSMNVREFKPWEDGRVRPWRDMPRFAVPMMRDIWLPFRWFGFFFPLGMIFGGLFWLAVIFLSVYGLISLFRGGRTSRQDLPPAAPTAHPVDAVPGQPSAMTCANCGQIIQEDWSHCPYCGHRLK